MLFRQDILQGIAEGRVTLALRRWRRAPPADGSTLRSPVGVLCLDRVTVVDEGEIDAIVAKLARIDAASRAPWTTRYLQMIADQPAVVSRVLAPQVGAELPPFKRRVRQLKELGLTESLEVGYRLSPRGRVVLENLDRKPKPARSPPPTR